MPVTGRSLWKQPVNKHRSKGSRVWGSRNGLGWAKKGPVILTASSALSTTTTGNYRRSGSIQLCQPGVWHHLPSLKAARGLETLYSSQ